MDKCDNNIMNMGCNNQDVKLVQKVGQSKNGIKKYNGKILNMCSECRKNNNGGFKIIKEGAEQ